MAGRVPELEAHRRALDLDHLVAVVHADGVDKLGREDILIEPQDEGGLAAGGISDHEQPDDVGALGPHLEWARRTRTGTLLCRHIRTLVLLLASRLVGLCYLLRATCLLSLPLLQWYHCGD